MTGTDLKHLLEHLDLNVPQAADLLGVHSTTVFRWLSAKNLLIRPDPAVSRILVHLKRRHLDPNITTQLKEALLVHGGLAATALLLSDLIPTWAR